MALAVIALDLVHLHSILIRSRAVVTRITGAAETLPDLKAEGTAWTKLRPRTPATNC